MGYIIDLKVRIIIIELSKFNNAVVKLDDPNERKRWGAYRDINDCMMLVGMYNHTLLTDVGRLSERKNTQTATKHVCKEREFIDAPVSPL